MVTEFANRDLGAARAIVSRIELCVVVFWKGFLELGRVRTACLCIVTTCAIMHVAAAVISYQTMGAVRSAYVFLATGFHILSISLVRSGFYRAPAFISVVLAGLLVMPQAMLFHRLKKVECEVERIVSYSAAVKAATGQYPQDLSHYVAERPDTLKFIEYNVSDGHLMVYYWSKCRNAPHWYSETSKWGYFDD